MKLFAAGLSAVLTIRAGSRRNLVVTRLSYIGL